MSLVWNKIDKLIEKINFDNEDSIDETLEKVLLKLAQKIINEFPAYANSSLGIEYDNLESNYQNSVITLTGKNHITIHIKDVFYGVYYGIQLTDDSEFNFLDLTVVFNNFNNLKNKEIINDAFNELIESARAVLNLELPECQCKHIYK